MFTNLCLVPLLLFTASLVPKCHFQLKIKKASPPGLVLSLLEETLLQPVLKTLITVFIIIKGWKINQLELRF